MPLPIPFQAINREGPVYGVLGIDITSDYLRKLGCQATN